MRKIRWSTSMAIVAILVFILPVSASAPVFPDVIPLPVGFRPEGIAVGLGPIFYTGSLADGAIYRGNLVTGEGEIFIPGEEGMVSVGMAFDYRTKALFVAGGPTGMARVFDTKTGSLLASYQLAEPRNFINDAVVTARAVYFTNSNQAVLYRLPLGRRGSLPAEDDVEVIELSGDWEQVDGFNANGIEAAFLGARLIVVNSSLGNLYSINPRTGAARLIDLGGESVSNGDGLLLRGLRLYVVQNRLNEIAVIHLSRDLKSGTVVDRLTNPNFDVPTTIAGFGHSLYAVNAKFGNPTPDDIPYEVVRVPLRRK